MVSRESSSTQTKPCNCRDKASCPLQGQCRVSSVVYKATLKTNENIKNYYGCCETEFKSRYYNHKQSFKASNKRNTTELSKAVWKAKDQGLTPEICWQITGKAPAYRCGGSRCNLCLTEKLTILKASQNTTLNTRSELTSKCRHKSKYKLRHVS